MTVFFLTDDDLRAVQAGGSACASTFDVAGMAQELRLLRQLARSARPPRAGNTDSRRLYEKWLAMVGFDVAKHDLPILFEDCDAD